MKPVCQSRKAATSQLATPSPKLPVTLIWQITERAQTHPKGHGSKVTGRSIAAASPRAACSLLGKSSRHSTKFRNCTCTWRSAHSTKFKNCTCTWRFAALHKVQKLHMHVKIRGTPQSSETAHTRENRATLQSHSSETAQILWMFRFLVLLRLLLGDQHRRWERATTPVQSLPRHTQSTFTRLSSPRMENSHHVILNWLFELLLMYSDWSSRFPVRSWTHSDLNTPFIYRRKKQSSCYSKLNTRITLNNEIWLSWQNRFGLSTLPGLPDLTTCRKE